MALVQAIEALGHHLTRAPNATGLAQYAPRLLELARCTPMMGADFRLLLDALREARNDAAHIGAAARRTTQQAITVALILEDALAHAGRLKLVEHYMVEGPVCAEGWQTLAMVRRTMLRGDRWWAARHRRRDHHDGDEDRRGVQARGGRDLVGAR